MALPETGLTSTCNSRQFEKKLPPVQKPRHTLQPILRNPKTFEINHDAPRDRSFSMRASNPIYTGHHQEMRLGFRRRRTSNVRLAPLEQKISVDSEMPLPASVLHLPTPTRALSKQLLSSVEAPQTQSNEHAALNSESPKSFEIDSSSTEVVPVAAECIIVSSPAEDVIPTEVSGQLIASEPAVLLEKVRQQAAVAILDVACGGQLGPMLESTQGHDIMPGDDMLTLVKGETEFAANTDDQRLFVSEDDQAPAQFSSVSGRSLAAGSDQVASPQSANLLDRLRQRAAIGIVEMAHEGKLGAMLEAAHAYAAMAGDDMFSLESATNDPSAVENALLSAADVQSVATPVHLHVVKDCLSGVAITSHSGADPDYQHTLSNTVDQQDCTATEEPEQSKTYFADQESSMINAEDGVAAEQHSQNQAGSSLLDRLREHAKVQFLKAAKSNELSVALQVATHPQDEDRQSRSPQQRLATNDTDKESGPAEKESGLLQQLRWRAAHGMAAVARDGSLACILQSAGSAAASEDILPLNQQSRTPRPPKTSTRTPGPTPRSGISQGSCGALGRQMVPLPTGLPTPSSECASVKSAVGRPGMFRRRHSRTSSKILT
eukprot:gnl/MRDRNA2_/MRDRNA2_94598_c0_seq1.p1 gnl/MRDRNA2_/MRDRNA2_94598_c0~~gnl/MRDRNA2_/MRDRNA2_94598_c0_seq1.p1  ORF type:complete len:605 (+),score=136.20 gnl/MRDRNA2_/MRDRNA2_94598_c0_seq1:74-1888(+)